MAPTTDHAVQLSHTNKQQKLNFDPNTIGGLLRYDLGHNFIHCIRLLTPGRQRRRWRRCILLGIVAHAYVGGGRQQAAGGEQLC